MPCKSNIGVCLAHIEPLTSDADRRMNNRHTPLGQFGQKAFQFLFLSRHICNDQCRYRHGLIVLTHKRFKDFYLVNRLTFRNVGEIGPVTQVSGASNHGQINTNISTLRGHRNNVRIHV